MDAAVVTATVLITGAGGYTGRHACRYFSGLGMRVVAALRSEAAAAFADRRIVCDMTEQRQVRELVEQAAPDFVVHLAGRNSVADSWADPLASIQANLMSTLYLLDALRSRHSGRSCRTLIVGSMLAFPVAEHPHPPHPYSLSKTLQMLVAQCWGCLFEQHVAVAKPSNLIGPGLSNGLCGLLARKLVKVERREDFSPFRLSSFIEERDYVDVRDAVRAYGLIVQHGASGQTYPVGSGRNRTIKEIVTAFQAKVDCDFPLQIGTLANYAPPPPVDASAVRSLGWEPAISFEQSVEDTLDYFRHHG